MNDRIKNAGIVLTTGVLLGWGTSAALATNIVSMNGLNAVVHNGDGTVTILTGVTPLTFDYGTEGTVARVDVTDGGAGYESAGLLTVEDLAATGGALTNMTGEFEFEGVVGSLTDNAVTLLTGGTGYDPGTDGTANEIIGNLLDVSGDAIVCTTTDWVAGDTGVFTGVTINDNNCGTDAGDVGDITIEGGLGYGDITNGSMVVTVDGVEITDGSYDVLYSTIANGAIELNLAGSTIPDTAFTSAPTIGLTPLTVDDVGITVNGAGFAVTGVTLWGSVSGLTSVVDGDGCAATAASLNLVAAGTAVIPADADQLATWSINPAINNGAVTDAAVTAPGSGYNAVPAITDGGAVSTSVATFAAQLSTPGATVTLADGTNPSLSDDWHIYAGGNFNNDANGDLLLYNAGTGEVAVWNNLNANIWAPVEVGTAGGGWAVTGLLVDAANGNASSIFWHKASTGANAVWMVDTSDAAVAAGTVLDPNSALTTAIGNGWTAACTNNSLLTGDNTYFYNADSGNSAVWNMAVDSQAGTISVANAQYVEDGTSGDRMVAGPDWMIAGVGAGQGADQADAAGQPACDIIWCNSASGNVAMWQCNPRANWQSNGEGVVQYNGAAVGVTAGNMLVGTGQYDVTGQYGTAPAGALDKTYSGLTMVWNNSGTATIWQMSTLIDQATWEGTGPAVGSGTGNIANPDHVTAYQSY
jgi:hypothetical protein